MSIAFYIDEKEDYMKEVKKTHVGAYGVIIQDNKIALIKKARGGYKGKLDLPGGGIEHDETPLVALKRELDEEAGVKTTKEELIDATSKTFKWQMEKDLIEDLHHIGIIYKVEIEEQKLKEEPDGIDSEGCNWYEIEKLSKNNLSPFTIHSLEKLGYKLS